VAAAAAASVAAVAVPVAAHASAPLGVLAAIACFLPLPWAARRLPESLRGGLRRHPFLCVLWLMVTALALVQLGLLSAFMADESREWGSATSDRFTMRHQCLSAYVHAADLARRGEPNLYHERWYPAYSLKPGERSEGGESPVEGLGPSLQDPYEYPPQFLLLPRAALALTNSFAAIRAAWFVVQGLGLLLAAALLAIWAGGREGTLAALLIPVLLASIPTLLDLQFGQFHVTAFLLSLGALVAFEKRRPALGGAALAFAILSKIFPGLILMLLLARRRWRDIGWTLAFAAAFTALSLAVTGWSPFAAFVSYQLPRIVSGEAFSFAEREGLPVFLISSNYSVYGLFPKLRILGVPGMTRAVAVTASWAYMGMLAWLAWRAGRPARTRLEAAQVWLALLSLASLRSPVAPAAYVVVPSLWLLTLLAGEVKGRKALAAAFVVAWLLIMGPPPLPDRWDLYIGLAGQGLLVAVSLFVLLRGTAGDGRRVGTL
jgi:hypothetical protein